MAVAYKEICQGEDPWIALGNFMNDWFDNMKDRREQLVTDPLREPESPSTEAHQWAAFCAASVEWFCQRYGVPCPAWVQDPGYTLAEPWFYYPQEKLREWLIQQTPEPKKGPTPNCILKQIARITPKKNSAAIRHRVPRRLAITRLP
jgi:hypothetical protein